MKAYSMDLRERIVAARQSGESVASVAQRFGVCTKTVRGYAQRAAQGRLCPTPRPGKTRRLSQDEHAQLGAMVRECRDWTLATLAQAWHARGGAELPSSTLHDALGRLAMTHKKRAVSPVSAARPNARRSV